MLDRIQYAAARIMLGALRCTKVENLELTANLLPLSLTRERQLAIYTAKTLSHPENPVRDIILNYVPYAYYDLCNATRPMSGMAYIILQNFEFKPCPVHQITFFPALIFFVT